MPRGAAAGAGRDGPILVVEDDDEQRACLAELLACAGYEVAAARDGLHALERMAEGVGPSLIVLDLTMPRMDGWAFLARLRGVLRASVPVIVTSALATERPPEGADACLEKPLDPSMLLDLVARLSGDDLAGAREQEPTAHAP